MNRVFILGSCVTRDAFELSQAQDFTVKCYLARTSIASSFSFKREHNDIDLTKVSSAFQKRMIINDLLKKTKFELLKHNFDWLIIDFIDERFDLFCYEDKSIFTLSAEFIDNVETPLEGNIIKSQTNEFFEYWRIGWDRFISFAEEYGFLHKVVVNKVYWTNDIFGGGKVVDGSYKGWIDKNNQWLDRLYNYVENKKNIQFLTYGEQELLAASDHKWGIQPYHYYQGFYIDFLRQLQKLSYSSYASLFLNANFLDIDFKMNESIVVQLEKEQQHHIEIRLVFASSEKVKEKEVLYTVRYYPELDDEMLLKMGYGLSSYKGIGSFKYIPTTSNSIYERILNIIIPSGIEMINIGVKEFYPNGKTFILDAKARLENI